MFPWETSHQLNLYLRSRAQITKHNSFTVLFLEAPEEIGIGGIGGRGIWRKVLFIFIHFFKLRYTRTTFEVLDAFVSSLIFFSVCHNGLLKAWSFLTSSLLSLFYSCFFFWMNFPENLGLQQDFGNLFCPVLDGHSLVMCSEWIADSLFQFPHLL